MTDLDLDALEATARAATPGPWKYPHRHHPDVVTTKHGCLWNPGTGRINDEEDAEHIAAFDPTTVLALIARLREAETCIDLVDDLATRHYLDTTFGRRVFDITGAYYKTTKTEGNEQ